MNRKELEEFVSGFAKRCENEMYEDIFLNSIGAEFGNDSMVGMIKKFRQYCKDRAVKECNGNKSAAAKLLKTNRKGMYR